MLVIEIRCPFDMICTFVAPVLFNKAVCVFSGMPEHPVSLPRTASDFGRLRFTFTLQ